MSHKLVSESWPKSPSLDLIELGELAINYAAGSETIFLKNSNNEIKRFSLNFDSELNAVSDNTVKNRVLFAIIQDMQRQINELKAQINQPTV